MLAYIKELFIEIIEDIPWDNVIRFFVIFMVVAIAVACFLGGLVLACINKSLWPLFLWIVTIFVASIFAACEEN